MEALLTWKYFLIPQDSFGKVKDFADELDTLRNRELNEEESARKAELIDKIDEVGSSIAERVIVYKDSEDGEEKDGTVCEELVYRMDEAPEVRKYTEPDEFYFKFLVYITPEGLQKQFKTIQQIFDETENHNLLKEEFLGEWHFLKRAKEIFEELREMYEDANTNKWGVVKIDRLEWMDEEEMEDEEELVDEDTVEA